MDSVKYHNCNIKIVRGRALIIRESVRKEQAKEEEVGGGDECEFGIDGEILKMGVKCITRTCY